MQDIQTKAVQLYESNMKFFEKNYPSLHNKLLALNTILNNNTIQTKYDLEYIDNYFDIKELESGLYLYNQNSNIYSEELLNSVSYKKNDQVFETQRNYNFDDDVHNFLTKETDDIYQNFSTSIEIINYHNKNIDKSAEMEFLDKYIFFGTGLGIHIDKIVTKFDLQVILIIEDNIEIFRLSLFTCDYSKISFNRDVFFSIAQNRHELHHTFHSFYTKAFIKNHYIKFTIFSSNYEEKIDQIKSLIITRPEATYSHERMLFKSKNVLDKLSKKYKFLNTQIKENEKYFDNKPFLVLGAGPSLQKNEEWLKKHADEFIIIAAFVALKTLKRIGVTPDIVAQIDENPVTSQRMLDNLGDIEFLNNSLFIFSASIPDFMFEHFNKDNIYLHEDRTIYKNSNSTIVVASVGETIYSLALIFNTKEIYLLGLDLALGDDGATHSTDHFMAKNIQKDEEKTDDGYQLDKDTIEVEGNFRDSVETNPLLAMSIPIFNIKTSQLKAKNQTVYNMSDGAKFQDTIALQPKDYMSRDKIDKSNEFSNLKLLFDSYSTNELSKEEKEAFELREKFINELYNLINEFKSKPYSNKDTFYLNYMMLINAIFRNGYNNELKELIEVFFLRHASFIADFFNTRGIKDSKKHSKTFKKILVKQLTRIVNAYEIELSKLTEEASKHSSELH